VKRLAFRLASRQQKVDGSSQGVSQQDQLVYRRGMKTSLVFVQLLKMHPDLVGKFLLRPSLLLSKGLDPFPKTL